MATYKDSLGNVYTALPQKPAVHSAKATHSGPVPRRSVKRDTVNKARIAKYNRYRQKRGKPNGPGQPGNKSGKNKIR